MANAGKAGLFIKPWTYHDLGGLRLHRLLSMQNGTRHTKKDKKGKKSYQHRRQIAKTIFCVINVENSVTSARSSRQFFWMLFLDAIAV